MQGKPKPSNKERCTLSVKFANSSSRLKAYQSFLSSLDLKPDMDVGKTQTHVNVLFAANSSRYGDVVEWLKSSKINYTIK